MEVSTVKKEVKIEVETSEKIWGHVAGEGEFENGAWAPGAPGKGPKKLKKLKIWKKMSCKYMVIRCRRGDW